LPDPDLRFIAPVRHERASHLTCGGCSLRTSVADGLGRAHGPETVLKRCYDAGFALEVGVVDLRNGIAQRGRSTASGLGRGANEWRPCRLRRRHAEHRTGRFELARPAYSPVRRQQGSVLPKARVTTRLVWRGQSHLDHAVALRSGPTNSRATHRESAAPPAAHAPSRRPRCSGLAYAHVHWRCRRPRHRLAIRARPAAQHSPERSRRLSTGVAPHVGPSCWSKTK
jgi:hypothetical protein